MPKPQVTLFESGNELAAYAAKQINYHVMGYYPITPSTQIAEQLDAYKAEGLHQVAMIAADGEHSAAGICYGAATGGGRVFNATSANGLLYALEQLPVQSGTRFPMVLNVACRTVSGPLSIKGDHSDLMYTLNTGWVILFAKDPQGVYDMNICALKIAEKLMLPVIVAFDGFFTSHQKRRTAVFENDADVQEFLGEYRPEYHSLDKEHPISIGCYMNEPDLLNNKYQLHLAMAEGQRVIPQVFEEFYEISGRQYTPASGYRTEDAEVILFLMGSSFDTAIAAAEQLRRQGKKVGVATVSVLRPFPADALYEQLKNCRTLIVCDRQDSYGGEGGNMTHEIKALLHDKKADITVISRVYGLSGRDFYAEDALKLFREAEAGNAVPFDYYGHYKGSAEYQVQQYFAPISAEAASVSRIQTTVEEGGKITVKGGTVKDSVLMPKRLTAGHGACPGCGIPVNVNLLLRGIEGNVVLLFHTGCGMVVSTCYPKTAFRTTYVHNLFQSGAATLSGIVEMYHEKVRRGELDGGDDFTFVMVSGDGGMDIGMGPALGAALRNHRMILMEYDNGGYMNTGYQLSYSTPKGARSSTSHVGKAQPGKDQMHKDMPQIMAAANIPYVATVAESNPVDFIKKAAKAQRYAKEFGFVYLKALSACPLNWGDRPQHERSVIDAAVQSCYHPLYEIEHGITSISYDPEANAKKMPLIDWLKMMGRTKHLQKPEYEAIVAQMQAEVDRRWQRLKARAQSDLL